MKIRHTDFAELPDGAPLLHPVQPALEREAVRAAEDEVEARLVAILDGMGDAFCVLDRELRLIHANASLLSVLDRPLESLRGRVLWDIFPHLRTADLERCFETMQGAAVPATTRIEVVTATGCQIDCAVFPLGTGIGISFRDGGERRRADEVLRESQAQIGALADNLPLGMVYQMDNGLGYEHRRFVYVSASCERLNGIPADRVLRDPHLLFDLILPEHRDHVFATLSASQAGQTPFDVEFAIRHAKTGQIRWQRIVDAPRILPNGATVWDGIQIDITDHKRAEDHLQLLVNELNHRVKNTLTTVQSLAAQSFHSLGSPDSESLLQSRTTFEARLFALARSHDILTRESWDGACLRDIARQAVEPYLTPERSRAFDLHWPMLRLSPSLALGLSMAFHEL